MLGIYLPKNNKKKIVSKFSIPEKIKRNNIDSIYIRNSLLKTLKNINVKFIDSFLLHNLSDLNKSELIKIFESMILLKEVGLVRRIGVSIYDQKELERLPLDLIDIVELPLSIYNQQFKTKGILKILNELGIAIHARSIFLQGLLLQKSSSWPNSISSSFCKHHNNYENILNKNNISLLQSALYFLLKTKNIEAFVFGITNLKELNEIILTYKNLTHLEKKFSLIDFDNFTWNNIHDIDPRYWQKKHNS